jgi:hypothetical protein
MYHCSLQTLPSVDFGSSPEQSRESLLLQSPLPALPHTREFRACSHYQRGAACVVSYKHGMGVPVYAGGICLPWFFSARRRDDNSRRRSSSSFHPLVALSVFQLCDALHGAYGDILPLTGPVRGLAALEGIVGQF